MSAPIASIIQAPAASSAASEEAAAIAAAIERFVLDTAPILAPAASGPEPWTRAAMLEGVTRETPVTGHPWINT